MRNTVLTPPNSKDSAIKNLLAELARFVTTGGVNTLLTLALYQFLVTYIRPEISYAIAWISGFVFLAVAYPKYVFKSETPSIRQTGLLLALYLASFSIGLFLMWLSVQWALHERLSVIIVIVITATGHFSSPLSC